MFIPSDLTPLPAHAQRRLLLRLSLAAGASHALPWAKAAPSAGTASHGPSPLAAQPSQLAGSQSQARLTDYAVATGYNNFYEFSTDKDAPRTLAQRMQTSGWQVQIDGLIKKPLRLDLDDLLRLSPMEERVYRLRCVEGWSMVIPWIGYSLLHLIQRAQPLGSAKFIRFTSLADPQTMPGVRSRILDWPYIEGLRLDEAMHPLTLLAFGMYGQTLPKQNGAPLRLVVPWKYGFKSAKSIVHIRFEEHQPINSWGRSAPREYGFYANVNPEVEHPRWSQSTERRIGEGGLFTPKTKTLLFNGYAAQVGQLYSGMDLRRFY